jgi:uncharacterized protein with HEPN domain
MPRDDRERDMASMHDMLGSIEKILGEASLMSKDAMGSDPALRDATLYRFIVLGEAANRVSAMTRETFPQIPWRHAWTMRNVLAHAYDAVSWDIVWDTIQRDLPTLEAAVRTALGLPASPARPKPGNNP